MSDNTITANKVQIDKENLTHLIENLSDANAQRVYIYIQGLTAGQNIDKKKGA